MSLSGNLGFVSLDEVLRLLTRSKQSGAVDVKGDRVNGRIYVDRRGIGLATTFTDETLRRHLTRSGLVQADQVADVASGAIELGSLPEAESVTGLLREMSVESLYQLGLNGTTFEVTEGQTSPFAAPSAFDLEQLLTDSKQRLTDWEEVRTIVSDMERDLMLKRDLGERDKVTVDRDSWRVIAELGTGASIRAIADRLGTTEFWAARVAAGLVEDGLMSLEAVETPMAAAEAPADTVRFEEMAREQSWDATPETPIHDETSDEAGGYQFEEASPVDQDSIPSETVFEEHVEPAAAELAESVDPNQSWWKEPEKDSQDEDEQDEEETVAAAARAEWASQQLLKDSTEVEEDTESFLEKVFSELEPTAEAEEGYGLLRRRRMGTLRDTGAN